MSSITNKTTQKKLTPKQKKAIEKGAVLFSENCVEVMKLLSRN